MYCIVHMQCSMGSRLLFIIFVSFFFGRHYYSISIHSTVFFFVVVE